MGMITAVAVLAHRDDMMPEFPAKSPVSDVSSLKTNGGKFKRRNFLLAIR
jgi:hypothetical protein